MKYKIDHDFHIHSNLSLCCKDERQTTELILRKAVENGFDRICLTNHFWDEEVPGASVFYQTQNYGHLCKALPLPQHEKVKFYFGCETDMDKFMNVGIKRETIDKFDFVIVSTTHLHMMGFTLSMEDDVLERRAARYIERFDALLNMDMPFYKIGIAHLTCQHIANSDDTAHIRLIDLISDEEFKRLFIRSAKKGLGIEINFDPFRYSQEQLERILRPYRLAKKCGCKFYFGSDSHHPEEFVGLRKKFETIVKLLELQEEDKFLFERGK